MTSYHLLVIIGNIASGKSSVIPLVAEGVGGVQVDADDLFQTTDPFRERYLENPPRWALANELWITLERAGLMEKAQREHADSTLVIDSGLPMSWVYTYSHLLVGNIDQDEWGVYEQIFDAVVGANLRERLAVVSLEFPTSELLRRIQKRGRDYELEFYTRTYLGQIDRGLQAFRQKLADWEVPVLTVDTKVAGAFTETSADAQRLRQTVADWWREIG